MHCAHLPSLYLRSRHSSQGVVHPSFKGSFCFALHLGFRVLPFVKINAWLFPGPKDNSNVWGVSPGRQQSPYIEPLSNQRSVPFAPWDQNLVTKWARHLAATSSKSIPPSALVRLIKVLRRSHHAMYTRILPLRHVARAPLRPGKSVLCAVSSRVNKDARTGFIVLDM